MVTIAVAISGNGLARVQEIANQVQKPSALLKVLGRRYGNDLKKWFRGRTRDAGSMASRFNLPEQGFWAKVAQSVSGPVLRGENTVVTSVTDSRFAQKVFGGRITPKVAESLSIPIAPEAAGLTPSLYEAKTGVQLFIPRFLGGGTSRMLCAAVQVGGKGTGIRPLFLLSKGVNQKKDEKALPPEDQTNAALVEEADAFLQRATENP